MENNNPLVSIVVVTYNSSKYVLETLESAKVQTYQNIELIISDDCSTDNTVEICRNWIEENKDRFVRTELITIEKNTGISANVNRAIKAAKGEWIKGIAGDDILLPNCIELNMQEVNKNSEIKMLFSDMAYYNETFSEENLMYVRDFIYHPITKRNITAQQQYKLFQGSECYLSTPTLFIHRSVYENYGYYNEKYTIEDWPFFLNVTKNGCKMYYLNKSTVCYRVRHHSVSHNFKSASSEALFRLQIKKDLIIPNMNVIDRFLENYFFGVHSLFDKKELNNKLLRKLVLFPWTICYKIKVFRYYTLHRWKMKILKNKW